jgi:triphosphoribosyl-dephospho-CoA synthase
MLPIGLCAQLACIWETTARKPGNVHRFRDFEDLSYTDFLLSAAAIAPVLENARHKPVGETVLGGVRATRQVVQTNTNLGILLLLAPLAAVPLEEKLPQALERILTNLTTNDSRLVYEAIGLATPGGMGLVSEQDIKDEPTQPLRSIMGLARDRDLIARQYVNGFQEVFQNGVSALKDGLQKTQSLEGAVIYGHLKLLADFPDSLIARKRGIQEAGQAARRAQQTLDSGWPRHQTGWEALAELDGWLRAEGHNRNPGTTADLVAASLFVALREGTIEIPLRYPWFAGFNHG